MANPTSSPSFSPRHKWSIAVNVTLATLAVFLILIGVNYLSSQYFSKRIYLSSDTRIQLSPRTVSLLKSLTNQVDITIYYDKTEPIYGDIVSLLNEYQSHTKKLNVKTIDYYRDPGAAEEFKVKYNLGAATNKDFVIFDNHGNWTSVDGSWLSTYRYGIERSTNEDDPKLYLNRKLVAFNGEMLFTSKLFTITQAKPLKAYFLQGHGERSPNDKSEIDGASKLADIFHRNFVLTDTLNNLLGTNSIPLDCNLLVINGPKEDFQAFELEKIAQYLDQGGRLFLLFDFAASHPIGLEKILSKWNVRVSHDIVRDPNYSGEDTRAFAISTFTVHDVTKSIIGSQLEIIMPRPIERVRPPSQASADEPQVTELAFSSTNSTLVGNPSAEPRSYPLMVAVERGAKSIVTERGTTRMLITGDSLFLDNQIIDVSVNQDFADSAVNWLLERTVLLGNVSARPVTEYRLLMNRRQVNAVKGILLGAIPGGILLLGSLVWLRRRK